MKIKNLILAAMLGALSVSADSRTNDGHPFPYPEPPEELVTLSDRTTYLVEHFWERCDLQATILRKDDFARAFNDYVSFMPYADADAVRASIDKLIGAFAKQPDNLLRLAEIAEDTLYSEDGEYISDEVFLPFAQAVVNHKKISSAKKARLAHEAKVVSQTLVGKEAPEIRFTKPDGSNGLLSETKGRHALLFFNDPQCDDCMLARVRLSADPNINQLIDDGFLYVVSIYPDETTDEWKSDVSGYNRRWIVGAAPDVDDDYDMRNPPVLYYLNPKGEILSKTLLVDNLLQAFKVANEKVSRE